LKSLLLNTRKSAIFLVKKGRVIMMRIEFTQHEIDQLECERYNHPHSRVQRKMEVLYLKSHDLPHKTIKEICNISSVTLVEYLKQYIKGGIEELKLRKHQGKPNELEEHAESLEEYFAENPPHSLKEAAAVIKSRTGVNRKSTQVREFLINNGFRYRKTASIPGKALSPDFIEKQKEFKEKELTPVLEEAKAGKREVFLWMPLTLSTDHS